MEQTMAEKLAAKMGIRTPEGLRVFTEGRSGTGVSHTEEVIGLRTEMARNNAEIQRIRDGRPAARREAPVQLTEKERARIAERTARAMGVGTAEGRRVFREGRSAFNPGYNAADPVHVREADDNV
jgi:hypothetical protein